MTVPEILRGSNSLPESPEVKTEAINYTTILKKLGLEEEQVTPDIITRLKEHFSLYTNGVEANLALLEEKLNLKGLDKEKKIEALKVWMAEEKARITATEK